jgi:glycosyltransferase involved in cell wall biosynthesis
MPATGCAGVAGPLLSKLLRILHFLWSGQIGGTERSVYQLVREQLREEPNDVGVLFHDNTGPYVDACRNIGCAVYAVGEERGGLAKFRAMVRHARGYDLHHFHSAEPLMFCASIAAGHKARVFTERGGSQTFESLRKRVRYAAAGPMLRQFFDGYSGNTEHAAAVAAERYRVPKERIAVTYNGIDVALLTPVRSRQEIRSSIGATDASMVVGTSARLKRWKRIDRLLAACSRLEGIDYRLVIVGDGPERPRLEEAAQTLGLTTHTVFTGMHHNVADYVSAMDVFVLPSNSVESFGNSVVEAMALGVTSIVFADSAGVCEHIDSGRTGFIALDDDDLTRILRELAEAAEFRKSIGAEAAAFVRSAYTPAKMASAYRRVYEDAVRRVRS